ncbi:MAG TPA: hypothetical protein VK420_00750, partial [Longimicrobium sp.]|nr:hypothetical protein [Longimicrobium sp.]
MGAPELLSPLGECASAFAEVAAPIAGGDVAAVPLGPLARSWDAYYFGPFSRFDALLRAPGAPPWLRERRAERLCRPAGVEPHP